MGQDTPLSLDELERRFWAGNAEASKIWKEIGTDLTRHGFTWAKYLKLLKAMRGEVIMYEMGHLPWSLFLGTIVNEATGPLGRYILEVSP